MKSLFILVVTIFTMSLFVLDSYSQQDVNGWYWLNGQPTGNTLKAVKILDAANMYAVGSRGTFMKSNDGGDTWLVNNQVGSPDNSSTGNLATRDLNCMWFFDANTGIVAGATQTVLSGVATGLITRTTNGGTTWNYIQFNDTAGAVNGLYFINANTGYLTGGTRARFLKTTDGGLTWDDQSFSPIVPANTYNAVYAIDTSHIFLATSSGKICTHLPGQDSAWKLRQLPGTTSATITDILFKDANTGYACGNANYFAYTLDGGATWTQSNAPATVGQRDLTYDAGVLYMAGSYYSYFKSTNNGVNWDSVFFYDGSNVNQPSPFIIYGMTVNGNDMSIVGQNGILNLSNDGGATWRNKNYSVNNSLGVYFYSSMYVTSDVTADNTASDKIWLGPNGGGSLLYSTNGGTNWTNQATSHTSSIYGIDFVNSNTGYICGGSAFGGIGQMSKTTDGGATWNLLSLPSPLSTYQLNNLDFVDENTGWVCGSVSAFNPHLIAKTTDGGATWTQQSVDVNPNGSGINVKMIDANTGYYLGQSGSSLYYTSNGGTNWTRNTNSFITSVSWSNMFILGKDIIYLNGNGTGTAKKVVRSLDGGQTWTDLTGNLLSTFTAFRTKWINLKHGIVSGTNGYMAKTTNGGLNWTASNPGGSTTVDCAIPNKNAWYAVSDRNSAYEVWRKYENVTSISLNVTMSIEGFWNGKPHVQDTVTVELHNSSAPYAMVDQAREVITINGYQTYEFYTASAGSYYIVLKHRNGLETWSANPITVAAGGNYDYDFTTAATQAYGNNMILKNGRYCIFSGDVNHDGVIDGSDGAAIDNDAAGFVSGYVNTDLNGDTIIDGADASIWENNAANNVAVSRP